MFTSGYVLLALTAHQPVKAVAVYATEAACSAQLDRARESSQMACARVAGSPSEFGCPGGTQMSNPATDRVPFAK